MRTNDSSRNSNRTPWLIAGGLLILLAIGFYVRWRYLTTISLYVDEFTTLWAASRVQELGLPRMPSGVLYTRGLLASYVEALFLTLFGDSYTIGRLPSLLFGLGTIIAIFAVGKRLWNGRVGLLAAAGLTLLPEAIIWSGRARFYAQLQFFALLAVWAAFESIAQKCSDTEGRRGGAESHREQRFLWLFVGLFLLSLFSQEQTILLYPSILLATVLWRGWRFLLRPVVAAAHLLIIGGMVLRYAIEKFGQPGYFETIQANRPYVGLIFDVRGAWATYAPLLIAPARLSWTLLMLVAIGVALVILARTGWRMNALRRFPQATLFFALQFIFVFGVMLTLVGTSWRDARYLFMLQPFWLLLGAAGAILLIERLLHGEWARWIATTGAAILALLLFLQPAQTVLNQQVEGYDRVLAAVAAERQPDDVIMSPQPPACAQVLGPCDYYALQAGYEEYVIIRDGVAVDRWSGAALLDSAEELEAVLKASPRVWFISDGLRLATRYDANFLRMLIEQFDIVFEERGVLALRADGWREQPYYAVDEQFDDAISFGPLALTGWSRTDAEPGQRLAVTLLWHATAPVAQQINTSLRIVADDGSVITQADGPPANGLIPTNLFFDTPLPDRKRMELPADLNDGCYRVELVAYELETVTALGQPQPIGYISIGESMNACE